MDDQSKLCCDANGISGSSLPIVLNRGSTKDAEYKMTKSPKLGFIIWASFSNIQKERGTKIGSRSIHLTESNDPGI